MTDLAATPVEPPRRLRLDWVPAVLLHPRQAFARIAAQAGGVWLTPLLLLTLTGLLLVLASGSIKEEAARTGQTPMLPDFQYWSPEQQAQYQQATAATSSPVFLYVFPAIQVLVQVWGGWLVVGGLLHLLMTLLGGRGDTGGAMNLVAWAALPYGVRDLVRAVVMWNSHTLISKPGLAGFAPTGEGAGVLYLAAFLALVDIYVIWNAFLLVIGTLAGNGLPRSKAAAGVIFTLLLVLAVQALIGYGMTRLGGLTVIRPFF